MLMFINTRGHRVEIVPLSSSMTQILNLSLCEKDDPPLLHRAQSTLRLDLIKKKIKVQSILMEGSRDQDNL